MILSKTVLGSFHLLGGGTTTGLLLLPLMLLEKSVPKAFVAEVELYVEEDGGGR